MFTGLVEERGAVVGMEDESGQRRIVVRAPKISGDVAVGDSIAVNGCCLTLCATRPDHLLFDLLSETLARTNLGALAPGSSVNLERALSANARLGGHFVQGHIDCRSPILGFEAQGSDYRLEVQLPLEFARYAAFKGSIAVDGISLTIAELHRASFVAWIIPHTRAVTNLSVRQAGDEVNLEFDLLAKYIERLLDQSPRG